MSRSPFLRWGLGALVAVGVLGFLRAKPWQRGPRDLPRQKLAVGFLPVT